MTDTPLTLSDYAADPNPLLAGVAKTLRENSRFMDKLPFKDVGTLAVKVLHEGEMPDTSWRKIGDPHASNKATKPTETEERAYSIGNTIVVDKAYVKDRAKRLYNPVTYQAQMVIKSIARNFNNKCINGLPTDGTNPVGLFWRVNNDLAASQRIDYGSGGLDISPDATGLASNIQTFFDALDELIYTLTDDPEAPGGGILLLSNDTMIRRYNSIARQCGLLNTSKDALGRTFSDYKGAVFVDMGRTYDDVTRVIGNDEHKQGTALTGGGSTPIYGVRLGDEYFTGWQEYPLESSPLELCEDKVTYKSVIDWVLGIALSHPRYSLARLAGNVIV